MLMEIELVAVGKDNWRKCISLNMLDEQKSFVASNVATIAESKFEPHYIVKAICLKSEVIGMLAYCREDEDGIDKLYWLFRLMIDSKFQGKGYGRQAVKLALSEMRSLGAEEIRTMHNPNNITAKKLYLGLGFKAIGTRDDGDILYSLYDNEA